MDENLLRQHQLERLAPFLEKYQLPAVGFSLSPDLGEGRSGSSKLGGVPDLPSGVEWPVYKERPLDFLLQVDLAEASPFEKAGLLPKDGLLTFFYNLDEQFADFVPADLNGFCVLYTAADDFVSAHSIPNEKFRLPERFLQYRSVDTIPWFRTLLMDELKQDSQMTEDERDHYWNYYAAFEGGQNVETSHRLLGHPQNVQGDMQLDAELIMSGAYPKNIPYFNFPDKDEIAARAHDWVLLLELDTDDSADLMWGDAGMLYYWIRKQDLARCDFSKVWMTLQCH